MFQDLEGVELGGNFEEQIEIAISSCAVVLVLIGRDWLNAVDEDGNRRLDDRDDYVRREITIALQRTNVVVIPLLVHRATMPRPTELPGPLAALAGRRGLEIRDDRWDDDMRLVIARLNSVINEQVGPAQRTRSVEKAFITGAGDGNPPCGLDPAVPADATDIIAQGAWAADPRDPTATSRRIARLFQQHSKGRQPMSVRSAGGFTAVMTLARAISDAGSTDPYKIRAQLRRVDLPAGATIMPWRGIQFNASGQNTRSQILLQQFVGGHYRVVYPNDEATDSAIFP